MKPIATLKPKGVVFNLLTFITFTAWLFTMLHKPQVWIQFSRIITLFGCVGGVGRGGGGIAEHTKKGRQDSKY